jgi:hypothetical protein
MQKPVATASISVGQNAIRVALSCRIAAATESRVLQRYRDRPLQHGAADCAVLQGKGLLIA